MRVDSNTNYYHFFGINDSPFSIAPDPHYLFLGEKHQEALAHLFYGIGNEGGFIVLTGEVGTGKTTICRTILQQIPDDTDVAYIVNPRQDATELLESICDELGLFFDSEERSNKVMLDIINKFLLASHSRGRHTLLIIDEAQNLSIDVLEQIRLLTNLETNQKKLLQLVLIGQPELADMLASRELRQLAQRVTARYHLETLSRRETGNYIEHRLKVAGFHGTLFSPAAMRRVYRASGGVPRLINVLCERCLLGAYVSESRCIDTAIVKRASRELKDPERKGRRFRRLLGNIKPGMFVMPALATILLSVVVMYGSGLRYVAPEPSAKNSGAMAESREQGVEPVQGVSPQTDLPGVARTVAPESTVLRASLDDREIALRELATRWNIAAPVDEPICQAVTRDGLSCLELELTPDRIAQLGLPGVIKLRQGGQRQYQVVETSGELQQLVQQGDQTLRFWVFWRSPPLAARHWPYSLGDDHDGVYWLQKRLNWYRGNKQYWVSTSPRPQAGVAVRDRFDWLYSRTPVLAAREDQEEFGTRMQGELKNIQQQLGWRATGQGDLLTLIKLDTLTNTRAPLLAQSG